MGDTQSPLLAALPIQRTPRENRFWSINPHYYISVNRKALSSREIRDIPPGEQKHASKNDWLYRNDTFADLFSLHISLEFLRVFQGIKLQKRRKCPGLASLSGEAHYTPNQKQSHPHLFHSKQL